MRKVIKYFCLVVGVATGLSYYYLMFQYPNLTQTQLLVEYWPILVLCTGLILISAKLDLDERKNQ